MFKVSEFIRQLSAERNLSIVWDNASGAGEVEDRAYHLMRVGKIRPDDVLRWVARSPDCRPNMNALVAEYLTEFLPKKG